MGFPSLIMGLESSILPPNPLIKTRPLLPSLRASPKRERFLNFSSLFKSGIISGSVLFLYMSFQKSCTSRLHSQLPFHVLCDWNLPLFGIYPCLFSFQFLYWPFPNRPSYSLLSVPINYSVTVWSLAGLTIHSHRDFSSSDNYSNVSRALTK